MKKKFLLSACLALSLVLAGCSTAGGNSAIKGSGPVEGVRLTQDTFNVDIGETYFLKSFVEFTPTYPADQTYTLESSNEDIFTVDSEQGSFTGVSIGVGTLTLTTNDGGYTASATVIVGGGISEDVPDDAGDSTITYTNYTLVFTLYDENLQVQKALDGDTLYLYGDYNGTWNDSDTGWWDWGEYEPLTETTDASGNVAYSITLSSVIGGSHEFMICVGNSWNPIRSDNFTFTIATTAVSGETHYYPLLNCYNFEEKFGEDPNATETEFYIVYVDSGSYSDSNSHTIQAGKAVFNGSQTCSGTNTTTGSSKFCIYNSVVATLTSGETDWYYIYEASGLDLTTGTITIPKNSTGYAVYVVEDNFSSPAKAEGAGTWTTGVSSITEFIATL